MLNNFFLKFTRKSLNYFDKYIIGGSNFVGLTTQPNPIGNVEDFGYDAKAIARWNCIPFQTFNDFINVGVLAFHISGINRVEFSVNNGDWISCDVIRYNSFSKTNEYFISLRASDFDDGLLEIRAIVYPNCGIPRVLGNSLDSTEGLEKGEHAIFLNSNYNNSLQEITKYVSNLGSDDTGDGSEGSPFLTLMKAARSIQDSSSSGGNADGGIILLEEGEYNLGTSSHPLETFTVNRWLTIKPKPGALKENVKITSFSADGLRTKLVHFDNVIFTESGKLISNGPLVDYYWVSNSDFIGNGKTISDTWSSDVSNIYLTDCNISNSQDGIKAKLLRNINIFDIGSDALTGCGMAINCTVTNIDPTGTLFHPDVMQFFGTNIENRIAFNITANNVRSQGFFSGDNDSIKDVAFINCNIDNIINNDPEDNVQAVFSFAGPTEHLYVDNCNFNGRSYWTTWMNFVGHNILVKNTNFTNNRIAGSLEDISGVSYINTTFEYI